MAAYATVPAEAEAEKPLLNRDLRVNLKTVIGGAAVASFVLGALAAAVVSGAPARTNSAALYAHSGYQPSAHAPMAFHAGKKNGESCKHDDECRSRDCHRPVPSSTRAVTPAMTTLEPSSGRTSRANIIAYRSDPAVTPRRARPSNCGRAKT